MYLRFNEHPRAAACCAFVICAVRARTSFVELPNTCQALFTRAALSNNYASLSRRQSPAAFATRFSSSHTCAEESARALVSTRNKVRQRSSASDDDGGTRKARVKADTAPTV